MNGIIYLHEQAGVALASAVAEVEKLTAEVTRLTAENEELKKGQ